MGLTGVLLAASLVAAAAVPGDDDGAWAFLDRHCLDCHGGALPEADLSLERLGDDLADEATAAAWTRVVERVDRREMPPHDARELPDDAAREAFVALVRERLAAHHPVGGAGPRRLTRREYRTTIEDLFGLEHELSAAFPDDARAHGFDGVGQRVSTSFLAACLDEATLVADRLFPPDVVAADPVPTRVEASADGFEFPARLDNDPGRVRLALSQDLVVSSCAWPVRFEARESGRYRVTVEASAFVSERAHDAWVGPTRRLGLFARRADGPTVVRRATLRPLAELVVRGAQPREVSSDVVLYAGETVAVAWVDGPVRSLPGRFDVDPAALVRRLETSPEFLAAWAAVGYELRGGEGNAPVERYHDDFAALAASLPTGTRRAARLLDAVRAAPLYPAQAVRFTNLMRVEYTRHGPALDVHRLVVEGPFERVDDERTAAARAAAAALVGDIDGRSPDAVLVDVVDRLLPRAFRRPLDDATRAGYLRLGRNALAERGRLADGLRAVVRATLTSPRLLLRGTSGPRLDDHDLATRLAYFLTGGPPDAPLRADADAGRLAQPDVLAAHAERLLDGPDLPRFVDAFTSQWLGTDRLDEIMPDARLFDVRRADVASMRAELHALFTTVLVDDLPVETLLDPGFTFVDEALASRVYGIDGVVGPELRRVEIPRGGAHGGLLGMAATMMATANGVDTQPVLRGVWLLDAVLGDPPPPPPDDVPALGSNTSGAVDVREQLARHRADARCAACHARIDPFGHVLEAFDPVGRLRTHYPRIVTTEAGGAHVVDGVAVATAVVLPDGTEVADVAGLKAWLVAHGERFATCLAGKLLTFATGREPTHGDRRVLERLVRRVRSDGGGLRGLVVELVASEVFAAR